MEEEPQHVPFVIHIAQSDAAWLAAWAPDPRALGAHAMGLAALRGLLAEDMPKDGQPLGGEIQHARALIENAHHVEPIVPGTRVSERILRASDLDGSEMFAKPRHDAASRIAALESRCALLENDAENAAGRITAVEEANAGMAHRLVGFGPPLQRIAALEESREASISVAGDHSRKLIGLLERIKEVEAEQVNAASNIGELKNRTANLEMRWKAKS